MSDRALPVSGTTTVPLTARDRHMRSLIVRLNLLTHVPASAASPEGGAATDEHPGGKLPKGGGMSGADWWRLYTEATDGERVIRQAEQELADSVRGPVERPAGETPAQEIARKTARVLSLHEAGGWTRVDIAGDVGLTIGQVSKIIMGAVIAVRLNASERKNEAEVVRLWREDQGRTVRYLAAATGVPKSTVQDILRRAA